MHGDAQLSDRLRAYELMELAQSDSHLQARAELDALHADAERDGRPEVALLAALGQALHMVVHEDDRSRVEHTVGALVARAEMLGSTATTALALALRAVAAGGRGESAGLLADAGRAVALVDDETLPALDRCTVLVVCAAAYNNLSLWELADELYDAAGELSPACERPVQDAAIAVNRVLIRLEWGAALFELGEEAEALVQLKRAAGAAEVALETPGVPPFWRLDVLACRDLLALVRGAYGEGPAGDVDGRLSALRDQRDVLAAGGDVEVLPLLDALVVLSLFRLGRTDEAATAARHLADPGSSSSGARSFPGWVRAHVLTGDEPGEAVAAHRAYGLHVARSRWAARLGVLAAARSRIAGERLSVDHARLSRDVLLDPLTGLSNRREFDEWLARTPGSASSAAVILVDVDSFKEVNDVFGHAVGDEVLRRVGSLLSGHVRAVDMALRLGGDEFAVVMTDDLAPVGTRRSESTQVLRSMAGGRAAALAEAVADEDWGDLAPGLAVRVSVGVAAGALDPDAPDGAHALYREADARLYASKSSLRREA